MITFSKWGKIILNVEFNSLDLHLFE